MYSVMIDDDLHFVMGKHYKLLLAIYCSFLLLHLSQVKIFLAEVQQVSWNSNASSDLHSGSSQLQSWLVLLIALRQVLDSTHGYDT